MSEPPCPKCKSEYTYADAHLWVCPQCAYEWGQEEAKENTEETAPPLVTVTEVRDAHGTVLQDGDSVTVIKDLKVKGASSSIKVGTKIKSIRLVDGHDGHNISCKVDGIGAMNLKSEFVKKN